MSEPIPILLTKFSTLENIECSFFQAGIPTNYYCKVECDNVKRSLDRKRVCGDAFSFLCRKRWNISQEKLTICINFFNRKEVATTDPEKDAEAANNVEATYVDLLEATIKMMKVKGFKGGLNYCRLLQIGRKAELQDRLIHAIKGKVPIASVVYNTKNKDGRPKGRRPKDERPHSNPSPSSS